MTSTTKIVFLQVRTRNTGKVLYEEEQTFQLDDPVVLRKAASSVGRHNFIGWFPEDFELVYAAKLYLVNRIANSDMDANWQKNWFIDGIVL